MTAAGILIAAFILVAVMGAMKVLPAPKRVALKPSPAPSEPPPLSSNGESRNSRDLGRYPERLAALERRLEASLRAGQGQALHLAAKRADIATKPGREGLADRYGQDLLVLEKQAEATRSVLSTLWRTRAVLLLRVHLAHSARRHPNLSHLPQPLNVGPDELDAAVREYARACKRVREFVVHLDNQHELLPEVVPAPSVYSDIAAEHRDLVEVEMRQISETFLQLRERMDALADTLDYLCERFRTQKVVEGTPAGFDLGPEAGLLVQEVAAALGELETLSAVGDKGLAEVAVDGLVSEITTLEKVGLDINLQADANREVERLLASFEPLRSAGSGEQR